MMDVILIAGKARSGKDTLADFIVERLENEGKKPCKIQVGQYIKYYVMKYFGWDGKEETKPRELLTNLGTEIIREKIDPDFHINRLIEDIRILSYFYDTFIVSDIRFPVEIEKPKKVFENVYTIKIERASDELSEKQKSHKTETALDQYSDYDYLIDNNGTLEQLKEKMEKILKEMSD